MSRKMIAIAVAAVFGISAIWYVVLWSPQGATLQKAQASAASAKSKETTLKAQVALLQRQRAQLPALNAHLATLKAAIPAAAGIDKVIDQINAVALAAGVSLTTLTPPANVTASATRSAAAGALPMGLSISVDGTYFQLIDFINRLTAMPRLAVVDGFSLATPDKSGKISTTITARVFVVPPPAPPPTTSTTIGGK